MKIPVSKMYCCFKLSGSLRTRQVSFTFNCPIPSAWLFCSGKQSSESGSWFLQGISYDSSGRWSLSTISWEPCFKCILTKLLICSQLICYWLSFLLFLALSCSSLSFREACQGLIEDCNRGWVSVSFIYFYVTNYPQTSQLETAIIYFLTVPVGQEAGSGLGGLFRPRSLTMLQLQWQLGMWSCEIWLAGGSTSKVMKWLLAGGISSLSYWPLCRAVHTEQPLASSRGSERVNEWEYARWKLQVL